MMQNFSHKIEKLNTELIFAFAGMAIIALVLIGVACFLIFKTERAIGMILELNTSYEKLTPEQKQMIQLPKWHTLLLRGLGFVLLFSGIIILGIIFFTISA